MGTKRIALCPGVYLDVEYRVVDEAETKSDVAKQIEEFYMDAADAMTGWHRRAKEELRELETRVNRLKRALDMDRIPKGHAGLCRQQYDFMLGYLNVLAERIKMAEEERQG